MDRVVRVDGSRGEMTSTFNKRQIVTAAVVTAALILCVAYAYFQLGLAPVILIGLPGLITLIFWSRTYLRRGTEPDVILPLFLITVAGFEAHLGEEYLGSYAPAISRLFNIGWTQQTFVLLVFGLAALLSLVALGLYYREPFAGFIALLFVFTRLSEIGLFVFPLLHPALQPQNSEPISQLTASGTFVGGMPNDCYLVTGHYYFPGMYTVALPIVPALYTIYRVWRARPTSL